MRNQIDILTNPAEFTTCGFMKIKEWGHDIDLRFLMPKNFRGRLTKVTWNVEDNEKHVIDKDSESWELFHQSVSVLRLSFLAHGWILSSSREQFVFALCSASTHFGRTQTGMRICT